MEASEKQIEIFIAEGYDIARVGLRLTLANVPDFKVVGESEDGTTTVQKVIELKPDVVLIDIAMPRLSGVAATERIKLASPDTRVMILTAHDSDQDLFAAIRAGADAYLIKELASASLISAVRAVATGVVWLDPAVGKRVLKASTANAPKAVYSHEPRAPRHEVNTPLSQRELDVLTLVVEGNSNQEIADRLVLSVETVKTHMRHIMEKLSVSDRTQAAVKAMREGLV
jgi:two-component system, NarL family, response regulator LiaR